MTDTGAGHVNRDKEWRQDNRYSVLWLSRCLSVIQWISGDGWRIPSSRWWKGATRPPKTSRCDYGSWHLARALSVKRIWMELDRASAAAPEQAGCAVSQYKGWMGLEPPLSPPLRLRLLGTLDWCDRASSWPTALAVTNHHCPTGRTGSAQLWRKDNRKRGQ